MPDRFHPRVLVVDGSSGRGSSLADWLERRQFEVVCVAGGSRALEDLRSRLYAVAVVDLDLAGLDGTNFLRSIAKEQLPTAVIALTARLERSAALEAMKLGAADYLTKPIDPDRLICCIERAIEGRRTEFELERLRAEMYHEYRFHDLISRSPKLLHLFRMIKQVAPLGSTVLIHGETGTGKELTARAIHTGDTRRRGEFVALNCAVLREGLLENELFGHEPGAYTGADRRTKGRFELADGGTLFLDEVAELPLGLQAKLLRVLQTGRFERVGGSEEIAVDVRLVAASNRRLEDEVKEGRFRADLYYRLKVIQLELPPLRERPEDIPLLATHFLQRASATKSPAVGRIEPSAMQALMSHRWPGNVRELENAILAGVALAEGSTLRLRDLPASIVPTDRPRDSGDSLIDIDRPLPELAEELVGRVERAYLGEVLDRYDGNVARTARHSGLSRRSVTEKIRRYSLERRPAKG
ncbi:MAG: sigma-54 dependent transcriptional regulator [Isosphaeraceae bacterium]|nr:sigma-54 dependent transcriptional regulator [Isosphaeraceae bacterium]